MHFDEHLSQHQTKGQGAGKSFKGFHKDKHAHYIASVDDALLKTILVDKHYKTMYFLSHTQEVCVIKPSQTSLC